MTREFYAKLKETFPEGKTPGEFSHWRFNYEQFAVRKLGTWKVTPTLEGINNISHRTLKRIKHIYTLKDDGEVIQGLGKGDVVIIPGYQYLAKTSHVIGITDLDIESLRVFFSTSWHSNYYMTNNQIERYINFVKEYFNRFG